MWTRAVAIGAVALVAAGCGNSHDDKTAVVAASAGGSAIGRATPTPPTPTRQQRADYKQHMKAGWAAQKRKQWSDAVAAFEAALVVVPFDQRAEAELGQSAMEAGDLAMAKRADELAVSQAVDHVVEAMARFNYGAVLEKTNDPAGALKQYQASLALRPNAAVQAAADRLAQANATPSAFCAAGKSPCECVLADAFGDSAPDTKPDCTETKPPVPLPGWHVYHVSQQMEYDYLLDDKHQLVAVIGDDNFRGYHDEKTSLDKAEIKTSGTHRVLWLQTHSHESEQTPSTDNTGGPDDVFNEHFEEQTTVIVCVLGETTVCPLTVPIEHEVTTDTIDDQIIATLGSAAGDVKPAPKQPPVVTKASVTIAADGTATVAVTAGKPDDALRALVGPHKLW